jgi:hypothetical protein
MCKFVIDFLIGYLMILNVYLDVDFFGKLKVDIEFYRAFQNIGNKLNLVVFFKFSTILLNHNFSVVSI